MITVNAPLVSILLSVDTPDVTSICKINIPLANIVFSVKSPDVARACYVAPTIPPAPVEEEIWSPVAPTITYENLPPAPVIIDTSPNQIIGCIERVGSNIQGCLNALFPLALDGNGVIERITGDYWKYDEPTWVNVGPNPGPTIVAQNIVPVWNETIVLTARTRSYLVVETLQYALNIETIIDPIVFNNEVQFTIANFIFIPAVSFIVAKFVPTVIAIEAVLDGGLDIENYDYSIIPYKWIGTNGSRIVEGFPWKPSMVWIRKYASNFTATTNSSWMNFDEKYKLEENGNLRLSIASNTGRVLDDNFLESFNPDGFTVSSTLNTVNDKWISYSFPPLEPPQINTNGTITSVVQRDSANFYNKIEFTGNGSSFATVGHSLGVPPSFFIIITRSGNNNYPFGSGRVFGDLGEYVSMADAEPIEYISSVFSSAATSTTIPLGSYSITNGTDSLYTIYAFADKPGYFETGTYIGTDSSLFIETNGDPLAVLIRTPYSSTLFDQFDKIREANKKLSFAGPGLEGTWARPGSSNLVEFQENGFTVYPDSQKERLYDYSAAGTTYKYIAFLRKRIQALVPELNFTLNVYSPSFKASLPVLKEIQINTLPITDVGPSTVIKAPLAASVILTVYPPLTSVPGTNAVHVLQTPSIQLTAISGIDVAPTQDAYYNNVSLLLHMDGENNSTNFIDSSVNNFPVRVQDGARMSTSQKVFGNSSLFIDGIGDSGISVPASHPSMVMGRDNFTIEFRLKIINTVATNMYIMHLRPDQHYSLGIPTLPILITYAFNYVNVEVRFTGGTLYKGFYINDSSWRHFAIVRNGTQVRLYVNGVIDYTTSIAAAERLIEVYNPRLFISNFPVSDDNDGQFYIDELRITKGVARYTAAFTPPTTPSPDRQLRTYNFVNLPTPTNISIQKYIPTQIGVIKNSIFIPLANIVVAKLAPSIEAGYAANVPVVSIVINAGTPQAGPILTQGMSMFTLTEDTLLDLVEFLIPVVLPNVEIIVPAISMVLAKPIPAVIQEPTGVNLPSINVTLSAAIPSVSTGTSVAVPIKNITIATLIPSNVGPPPDIEYIGISSLATGSNSVSTAWPSGHASGDLGICYVTTSTGSPIGTPSGWTHIATAYIDSWQKLVVSYKYATSSSEPNVALSPGNYGTSSQIICLRGTADSSPIDVSATRNVLWGSSPPTPSPIDVTTTGTRRFVISFMNWGNTTWAPGTNWVTVASTGANFVTVLDAEYSNNVAGSGPGVTFILAGRQSTAGASPLCTLTHNNSFWQNLHVYNVTLAVKPA